jgi:L-ascorbate metabolism protein UlaG (beta-lactamase superfamily)
MMAQALLMCLLLTPLSYAHEKQATATYLANEAVLVSVGEHKVLFDPFYHNNYGIYQLVPEKILSAVMSNTAPYDDIDVIFVSHAHDDHFAADDTLAYLLKYKNVKLVASKQAIEQIEVLAAYADIASRVTSIELEYGDAPISFDVDMIKVDSVRIPHAGWPGRAEVSNLVYRITLPYVEESLSFMHMGDADPNDTHFRPLSAFWNAQQTDLAFPPYWFFLSNTGNYILDYRINSKHSIGVHVPKEVPAALISSEKPYFSTPGEVFTLPDR